MKIFEFLSALLEYDRNITATKLGDKLVTAAQRDRKQSLDEILNTLEEIDPTQNKQYIQWLAKQYIAGAFRLEDVPRINQVLINFEKLKSRLEIRDINKYTLQSLETLIDKLLNVDLGTNDSVASGNFPVVADSEVLYNGPFGQLSIPKTVEASCDLGRGTKWCTAGAKKNRFNAYNKVGPLYIWRDKNGEKYQFYFGSGAVDDDDIQFMDARDEPIDRETFVYFRKKHPILSKLFNKVETELLKDPGQALAYARFVGDRVPGAESVIATDPENAIEYVFSVIKGRWPEAEPYIMKEPDYAVAYAQDVIKGPWPEAEQYIMKDPGYAFVYAQNVIKGRWPEAEQYIMKDPYYAVAYAQDVIKGPWPEAEQYIMKDPKKALYYAIRTIKGRWPEAEQYIIKDGKVAADYAVEVLRRRWPKAESVIAKNSEGAWRYVQQFIKGPWPEAERALLSNPDTARPYTHWYINKGKNSN